MSRVRLHGFTLWFFAAIVLSLGAGTLMVRGRAVAPPPVGPDAVAAAEPLPAHQPTPADTPPATEDEPAIEDGPRILVSLDKRRLWFVKGADTLLSAPVAIGRNENFEFNGRKYYFATPRGTRRVLAKQKDPIWTVPEWHYFEKAVKKGLEVVHLDADSKVPLEDGSFVVVMGDQVGRVNQFGFFAPFTPGNEIIFDGKIFVPPLNTAQRKVPDALGPYKLDTGDGYLIHGTHMYNEESIGGAVSHGCVRMDNSDLERLYRLADRGTPVIIF
jgi:lipoprotein-anchoring transpeptidase ErfK/SrfK